MPRLYEILALFFFRPSSPLRMYAHIWERIYHLHLYYFKEDILCKNFSYTNFRYWFFFLVILSITSLDSREVETRPFRTLVLAEIWANRWITTPMRFHWSGSLISIGDQKIMTKDCVGCSPTSRCIIIGFPNNASGYFARIHNLWTE